MKTNQYTKNTLRDVPFADLLAMRKFAIDLKYAPRRSRTKWQGVIDGLNKEMLRRIEMARRLLG